MEVVAVKDLEHDQNLVHLQGGRERRGMRMGGWVCVLKL